ncbi:Phosphopantothenoylcysteine decarboxylase [Cyanobacterium stanieri PCC 7202]|uniref:Coenzyme A biosynthesis bifunctional protein CoaBC n=1 Tax=Cyanobacterium stanieri (strain ATCC 29140 / PCC 7202) TaxID=292563 RepID=K9YKX1_CYASC|nr:Phosphopantothenoylcysteine decarboxylase [Cyanobacterium stanieri PCC 7202]
MTNHKGFLQSFKDKKILVCIGGGIAAYKVCGVISQLFQKGAQIEVILTESAQKFITPLTVSTLARTQAYTDADFWQPIHPRPLHIHLGEWADLILIAPLTANTLAKLVHGMADNLLTNTVLASNCPIAIAPAMNTEMWLQSTVQDNWELLGQNDRFFPLHTNTGLLACDRTGQGRMAEPEEILMALESALHTHGKQDLKGKNILISTGGTREFFDPVRFIGNPSTGKMGIALAVACHHRGAKVTLVGANIAPELLKNLPPLQFIDVTTAEEMEKAMVSNFPTSHWAIMASAVADVKPREHYKTKLSKANLPPYIELDMVTDIVAKLGKMRQPDQILVGFAAQTGDIVIPAQDKLSRKKLSAIVANPIDKINAGFGSDTNEAIFINAHGQKTVLQPCSKLTLSHQIIDLILGC